MSDLLSQLNEEQRAVVTTTEGNLLVLSGAGSGKTMALTYKVAYLIDQKLADSESILAVTFTNKAAKEMKTRVLNLIQGGMKRWWIGTFHSVCVRILVKYGSEIGVSPFFTIADEKEQKKELKVILESHEDCTLSVDAAANLISWAKNNLVKPDMITADNEWGINPITGTILREYNERLEAMNTLDFDDLISKTIDLLQVSERVRSILQEQFKYVLVDEGQDLNRSQYLLTSLLSGRYQNLMIIGDTDQNIYSWRGATLDVIMEFARLPTTKTLKMEQNYRCSRNIVEASNTLISNNQERLDKILWTSNDPGEKITYYKAEDNIEEANYVAKIIDYYCNVKKLYRFEDIAILYRMNNQAKYLENFLSKNYIPYNVYNGNGFYQSKVIKDVLAYLKILINPYDIISFQRIINEPKRNIGESSLQLILDFMMTNKLSIPMALERVDDIPKLSAKARENLKKFAQTMAKLSDDIKKDDPERLVKDLVVDMGYMALIREDEEAVGNVMSLIEIIKTFKVEEDDENEMPTLYYFVKHINLVAESEVQEEDSNCVKLISMHSAKGLEFQVVFIVGFEENVFPHFNSIKDHKIEEERRLCYVSITRAKKKLFIVSSIERVDFGRKANNAESRFLKEIPEDLIRRVN